MEKKDKGLIGKIALYLVGILIAELIFNGYKFMNGRTEDFFAFYEQVRIPVFTCILILYSIVCIIISIIFYVNEKREFEAWDGIEAGRQLSLDRYLNGSNILYCVYFAGNSCLICLILSGCLTKSLTWQETLCLLIAFPAYVFSLIYQGVIKKQHSERIKQYYAMVEEGRKRVFHTEEQVKADKERQEHEVSQAAAKALSLAVTIIFMAFILTMLLGFYIQVLSAVSVIFGIIWLIIVSYYNIQTAKVVNIKVDDN